MNRQLIEDGVRLLIQGLDVDPNDHNFTDTPRRVADVYAELFTPAETGWPVFAEKHTDMVCLRNFVFYTLCPHHLLPVRVSATVAYVPNGKVIGASKLGRLLLEANRKPETQEALTDLAVAAVERLTEGTSRGTGVVLVGEHGCFRVRGIKSEADMVTSKFVGVFETDAELKARFWRIAKV